MNDYKDIYKLNIYKNSEFAGVLQRTEQGCELQLHPTFIENYKVQYFSYCIPKTTSHIVINGDNLPPFFAGLLPEGRRLNALISKLKTSHDDLFSLLAAVGTDCIGDNIKRKTFIDFAERYGVSRKAINSAFDKLLERFKNQYQALYSIDMTEKKQKLLHRMITRRISDLG